MTDEPKAAEMTRSPFLETLGMVVLKAVDGEAEIALTIEPKHMRSLGMLHGGVTASLIDSAAGHAAHSVAPEGHLTLTIQLNINYLRPAKLGDRLTAFAVAIHSGKRTAVVRVDALDQDRNNIAVATATMMYAAKSKA
jgi:uncharacterized protein (TIGR00369 family)